MRIYLTGFMGSGKTTVGRILAAKIHADFLDLDQMIEQSAHKSIAEIFNESGEAGFRELETATLHSIKAESAVVATGGGCFIHNTEWMLANGTVIYLELPLSALASRIGANPKRPLWRNAEPLFAERESIYKKAHFTVDGTLPPDDVATSILEMTNRKDRKGF
jgi:shikimate kinase